MDNDRGLDVSASRIQMYLSDFRTTNYTKTMKIDYDNIKVKIIDNNLLNYVTPKSLSYYLKSLGWKNHGGYRECADIYVYEDMTGMVIGEIIAPKVNTVGDYAARVGDVIEYLVDNHYVKKGALGVLKDLIEYDEYDK